MTARVVKFGMWLLVKTALLSFTTYIKGLYSATLKIEKLKYLVQFKRNSSDFQHTNSLTTKLCCKFYLNRIIHLEYNKIFLHFFLLISGFNFNVKSFKIYNQLG